MGYDHAPAIGLLKVTSVPELLDLFVYLLAGAIAGLFAGLLGVGGGRFGAVDGGLFGLTKTLNLEWESVFCRALDLSPDLDAAQSVSSRSASTRKRDTT